MARLISEGFEVGSINTIWTRTSPDRWRSQIFSSSPAPRTGTYAFRTGNTYWASGQGEYWKASLGSSITNLYGRAGFYFEQGAKVISVMYWYDSANAVQAVLRYNPVDGADTLNFYRGDGTTLLGSVSCTRSGWHTLQWQYVPDNSSGIFKLYIDGVLRINITETDTQATENANVAYWSFGAWSVSDGGETAVLWDDIALNDTSGSYETGLPGTGGFVLLKPNGNGNASQLVGSDSDSTDNYALVDEVPPSSTDYVGSDTAEEYDLYTLEAVPETWYGVVLAIPTIYGALSAAGTGGLKIISRQDGTDYDHDSFTMTGSYARYDGKPQYLAPDGTEWTPAKVDDLELGVEIV